MDAVQLQNRMDTKLIFPIDSLPSFLEQIKKDYLAFEINGVRLNPYRTLYFDDENWLLYLLHHNQKMNRFKLRYRTYLSSDLSFFEIKHKNNKNRTVKERIKVPGIEFSITENAGKLLHEITGFESSCFVPKLWVHYSRITLVSKSKDERVTLDVNLSYKNEEKEMQLPELIIAEVKQGRSSSNSPFLQLMKHHHIRPGSISKYCLGVALLQEGIKKNNFKMKLRAVEKIHKPHTN